MAYSQFGIFTKFATFDEFYKSLVKYMKKAYGLYLIIDQSCTSSLDVQPEIMNVLYLRSRQRKSRTENSGL